MRVLSNVLLIANIKNDFITKVEPKKPGAIEPDIR